MKAADTTTARLWRIAEPVCAAAGYELVDMSLVQSPRGWVLRVFIDRLGAGESPGADDRVISDHAASLDVTDHGGSSIGVGDCERVSRELSAVLDVEDPIAQNYELEVSSPGLDRPLRTPAHFERYLGRQAKIALHHGIAGRRNFTGILVAVRPAAAADEPPGADLGAVPGAPAASSSSHSLSVIIINVGGTPHELPFDDISSARLVPDWDALFAGKGEKKSGSRGQKRSKPDNRRDRAKSEVS